VGSFTVPYAFDENPIDYKYNGLPAHSHSSRTVSGAREHFWKTADADFRGWRNIGGETPYGKVLRDRARFFDDRPVPPPAIPLDPPTCSRTAKIC
jgi:hypothetical protein